jgi:acetolactate synthase I/II/III large subunit
MKMGLPDLSEYGLRPATVAAALANSPASDLRRPVGFLLGEPAQPNGLTRALLHLKGPERFAEKLAGALAVCAEEVSDVLDSHLAQEFHLTGADAVALTLAMWDVRHVFAYAGTSELALCDRVARTPPLRLINGRGDKESAFLAGGASLLSPLHGASILHAARGLTNAAGAVGDLRRSEVATVIIVGMPSTSSAPFLPPHGEEHLLEGVGSFAKWWVQPPPVVDAAEDPRALAAMFVDQFHAALRTASTRPFGPVLFGVPQDTAETAWLPWSAVSLTPAHRGEPPLAPSILRDVADRLASAKHPVIIVDDYLLKYPDARRVLRRFSNSLNAPVLQLRYTRGAMLFERLSRSDIPSFIGWYDPTSNAHTRVLANADLLVTLEDRNMYPRVIGPLPPCPKIAVTSSAEKVIKNRYLASTDMLLVGDVVTILCELVTAMSSRGGDRVSVTRSHAPVSACPPSRSAAQRIRVALATVLGDILGTVDNPVLVDDSQMLGGLLCLEYDRLPPRLRVFGSHGGFVGGGLASAAGLALSEPDATVVCTLGDQGFTNGVQGLAVVGQERAPVVCLVCNNGGALSLEKQARSDASLSLAGDPHLGNVPNMEYTQIAAGFGIDATSVEFETGIEAVAVAAEVLRETFAMAIADRRPHLIEVRLPRQDETWGGVWNTAGYESTTGLQTGSKEPPARRPVRL